jgi:hypothetical protein
MTEQTVGKIEFNTSKIGPLDNVGKRGGIQRCHHDISINKELLIRVLSVKRCFYEDINTRLTFHTEMTIVDMKELATWLIQRAVKDTQV